MTVASKSKAKSAALGIGAYAKMWSIVDGGVADALKNHPDYLTPKGHRNARTSIVKRVTGTVIGFAEQSAKGRPQPAETAPAIVPPGSASLPFSDAGEGRLGSSPTIHRVRIINVRLKRRTRYRAAHLFDVTLNALRAAPVKKEG